ncbi:MAG: ribosome-associated translation inhibitor RaiA [Nitrospirae bacterium]|nr:ribosome-associated translation inhibitor RaiA [Nitrospirota bacterium]
MNIQITGRHLEVTPTLKEYIESRLHKIEKYSFKILDVQVILDVEKYRHHAEMTVGMEGFTLQAHDETEEMYSTIDKVIDKIEKQLKKHKEKVTRHRIKPNAKELPVEDLSPVLILPRVIKEKAFKLKPISQKEAISQMESLQKDFFIYLDNENKDINVLYRRKAGSLGLIHVTH